MPNTDRLSNRLPILAILLISALAISCERQEKVQRDVASQQASISITAEELYKDYEDNEVAADQKYKTRVLEVSGTVESIGKDILDEMYVTLKVGEYSIMTIQCYFSGTYKNALAQLKKGQRIKLKGRCDGKFGNVLLKGCILL